MIWEGGFKDGNFMLNGKGKHVISGMSGQAVVWEGEFDKGVLQGPGKCFFADGTIFEGEYRHGNLGKGKITRS